MTGVHRFLARKEKRHSVSPPDPPPPAPAAASVQHHVNPPCSHTSHTSFVMPNPPRTFWLRGSRDQSAASDESIKDPKKRDSRRTSLADYLSLDRTASIKRPRLRSKPSCSAEDPILDPSPSTSPSPSPPPPLHTDESILQSLQAAPDLAHFRGIFVLDEPRKKLDKDDEKKVRTILSQLHRQGIYGITEPNIEYALQAPSAAGNAEEAYRLCMLLEDTHEGLLQPYNPTTTLLGAINREGVTCYLDALLFAMFARLDSFEAMLYNSFDDLPRKRLAGVLRLWVNMLRSGKIITVDITKQLQDALADCGWRDAARVRQQDTSEAFSFITGQLELPLLTLKMDLYHTGKEDPNDDHKFVNERLLEVAILEEPAEGSDVIRLEDCLEAYFNNRIEVKRHMEHQRRNTLKSKSSMEKSPAVQAESMEVETIEEIERYMTPDQCTPIDGPSTPFKSPLDKWRPVADRKRTDSIFSQRRAPVIEGQEPERSPIKEEQQRKNSLRTEVLMPAWQFFKLLPWYTSNIPTSDAQVAAHFARKRPVLGICLKRYMMSNTGEASRLNTYVDIPLEIKVPDFVSGDDIEEDSPLVGNFKLVLQSVVCHRGRSVHSGHYVSLVRGYAANAHDFTTRPGSSSSDDEDPWMLFDDIAKERVQYVDIVQALKDECPYLVFYQVQPIDDDIFVAGPPSYDEAISRRASEAMSYLGALEKTPIPEYADSEAVLVDSLSPTSPNGGVAKVDALDWAPSTRTSMDASIVLDERRRFSTSSGLGSTTTHDDSSVTNTNSVPSTPLDEARTSFLQLPSRRASRRDGGSKKSSKSRPSSQGGDGSTRFNIMTNMSMSKLTQRMSRSDLPALMNTTTGGIAPASVPLGCNAPLPAGDPPSDRAASTSMDVPRPESRNDGLMEKPDKPDKLDRARLWKDKSGEKPVRSKEKEHHHHHHHLSSKKKKEAPDRDCIVM